MDANKPKTWKVLSTDEYLRAHKIYEKKHPNELESLLDNLDRYMMRLQLDPNPKAGFVRNEGQGLYALSQEGYKTKA